MDIHSVRAWMKTKSIYEIPLRVTFYARVSTESDEQLNSLGNQISYYENLIKQNKNWIFVPGYIDEGLSAAARKRALAALPKPRTGSLFKSMSLATVTLEEALQLLSLPRVVGVDPESGDEITAQNGRYGPYLKKGTDSRTLPSEEQLLTITLEEALAIYAQPKRGRGATASAPLRELGETQVPVKVHPKVTANLKVIVKEI